MRTSELSVILYEPEGIIKMLLATLFRSRGADVLEVQNSEELLGILHERKRDNRGNRKESGRGQRVVVLGEPSPHRKEHELVRSLPRSFPEYTFLLLAGGTVYPDTAEESLFHGVVSKPFSFEELLEAIDRVR
ncbi:MAG: hypothetical protein ACLFQW_00975 [Spirochaetaceae bacterium]